ncbi:MAG: Rrf2 family transcriptional regulator [Clostridia bacterium]|nr:Rrf2 family transcriptional regulator [Clostridia bacterium]
MLANIFHMSEMVSLALHSILIIAAKDKQLVNAKKISEIIGASEAHLAKTLQQLVKAGYIRSVRGPKGGFTLLKEASEITLLDIYQAIEGPIRVEGCPMNCEKCAFKTCIFGGIPEKLNQEFRQYMMSKRVSDFKGNLKYDL